MPTRRSASIAIWRACRLSTGWWSRIPSTIWLPTVWIGENEVIGSWKIIAISAPRMRRISWPRGSSFARSTTCSPTSTRRWYRISPPTIRPGLPTIPRSERDRADVLRLLQQHAPGDRRVAQAQPEEAERRLSQDHLRHRQGERGDDVTRERRDHVLEDDRRLARAGELGRGDEVLLAQR